MDDFEEALRKSIEDVEKKAAEMHDDLNTEENSDPESGKSQKGKTSGAFGKKVAKVQKRMHVGNVETSSNNEKRQYKNENFNFRQKKDDDSSNDAPPNGPNPGSNWNKNFSSMFNLNTILFYLSAYMGYRFVSSWYYGNSSTSTDGTSTGTREVTFDEFLHNYMSKGQIRSISIHRQQDTNHKVVNALTAETITGVTLTLHINNVDHFLENLETLQ